MTLSEHWREPEGGQFAVAISAIGYPEKVEEVETFFGRKLACYSHALSFEHKSYVIFFFRDEDDAELAASRFDGKPFDPRDKGRGKNWMKWMKGRGAREDRNRDPYK